MNLRHARGTTSRSMPELVGERLGLLEPQARAIVALAALIGYRPDLDLLTACSDAGADATADALQSACHLDLLVRERLAGPRYRFRHALTRAAISDALSPSLRRALHARIAATLERLPTASSRVEELAHHWSAAGDAARARVYNERAAEEALRIGADGDAAQFSRRARCEATRAKKKRTS
jgi:predicted ATPase